ncbi:MAG: ribosome maturation factor RimM [Candidatus Accumulibacter sp.]|jgi:16S rRNA processing protein RimM|nr:ribosome maturation factor RimM [Accumulibacter sp.]
MSRRREFLPEDLPSAGGVRRPEAPSTDEIIVFGKVIGAYGLRGAIKLYPFVDDLEVWARLPEWRLGHGEGARKDSGWLDFRVLRCVARNRLLIAEFEGLTDRGAVENLRGMLAGIPRDELPAPGKNEFYWADLIDLDVENLKGQPLGRVLGLIETPANDVLRVSGNEDRERLLPFVASVVLDVDRIRRKIRVDWEADW